MVTRLYYTSETQTGSVEEHCLVALKRGLKVEGARTLPAGSIGAVVAVLKEGVVYMVEFSNPFAALVDVAIGDFDVLPAERDDDRLAGRMDHRAS